ncbi:MAG: hypothetical protein ACD_48C00257G0005 [uncultured bacterium]|nr:MAG: hypothetical protein ACD_48C00257G0005 [uncultured bacterium]
MKLVKKSETTNFSSSTTNIYEYPMDMRLMNGAIAEIKGRYPEKGFAMNEISDEIAYVVSGSGEIELPKEKHSIISGDTLYIQHHEQFAWNGNLSIFMVTSPKFNPKQHKIIL